MEVGETRRRPRRGFSILLSLVAGIALGVAATLLLPKLAEQYVPESLRVSVEIEGTVWRKEKELDRLLLRITSEEGVVLASFTQKQREIDLLIEEGDLVTLRAPRFQPFLEDPRIERVRKPAEPAGGEPAGVTVPSREVEPGTEPVQQPVQPAEPPSRLPERAEPPQGSGQDDHDTRP